VKYGKCLEGSCFRLVPPSYSYWELVRVVVPPRHYVRFDFPLSPAFVFAAVESGRPSLESCLVLADKSAIWIMALWVAGRRRLGIQAHCQRVAAWSSELAVALGLSLAERNLVEQAALYHHSSQLAFDSTTRHGLLADLKIEEKAGQSALPEDVEQLLHAFWGNDAGSDGSIAKLAAVLRCATISISSLRLSRWRNSSTPTNPSIRR